MPETSDGKKGHHKAWTVAGVLRAALTARRVLRVGCRLLAMENIGAPKIENIVVVVVKLLVIEI